MKASYQEHIDQIIDFNEDDYGYGPMVFLEGYLAILGAGNEDDYVEHLVNELSKHQDDNNLNFIEDLLPWSESIQRQYHIKQKV